MSASTYHNYSPGLEGVIGGISKIAQITSATSTLVYRGIHVHELAEKSTYEETAYLLLNGRLPTQPEFDAFMGLLTAERPLPKEVISALRSCPSSMHPMDALKIGYSMLAPMDPDYTCPPTSHDANQRKAGRIIAKAATIVAASWRLSQGEEPIPPDPALRTAANFLYMLTGEKPDEYTEKVMDASLILYAEHTFNASTFASRVTVSTLSDIYSGITSGIGTLKGPLHGGANEEAMRMLLEIGSPEHAREWVKDALRLKRKVMGFGHREYKHGDSRAFYMSKVAKELGIKRGITKWGEVADILEEVMLKEKGLYPNVDFPSAYAYYLLDIPIDLYTPIFVIARTAGWCSHAIEQLDNNRLIRPTCIYEGPTDIHYVPIEERGH